MSQSALMPSRFNCSRCTSTQCCGIGAALGAELLDRHLVLVELLLAILLLDLPLDRQAVAVPAGHVGRVLAEQGLGADDHVLERVVERMADVDVAVGVGRAVVEDELLAARARLRGPGRRGPPPAQRARIAGSFCGRPAFIGKSVLRQEDGRAVIGLGRYRGRRPLARALAVSSCRLQTRGSVEREQLPRLRLVLLHLRRSARSMLVELASRRG